MDLVKFLSPKHVILVHGEKPKMASLKGRIQSELGIQCYDPANNDTVCLPSTHYVKAGASNTFIRSSLNPNFKFSKTSSEDKSDSGLKDTKTMSRLQVSDERVAEGILVMEKNKKAKVVNQDELLPMLGELKHEVRFAYCCPVHIAYLSSAKNGLPISDNCSWLRLLFEKVSSEIVGESIQDFGEHLQVESFHVSVCLKDNCPYRTADDPKNESEAVFFCCNWSVVDEKLAWKVISFMESLDLSTI